MKDQPEPALRSYYSFPSKSFTIPFSEVGELNLFQTLSAACLASRERVRRPSRASIWRRRRAKASE
jgi:hypothetical protein